MIKQIKGLVPVLWQPCDAVTTNEALLEEWRVNLDIRLNTTHWMKFVLTDGIISTVLSMIMSYGDVRVWVSSVFALTGWAESEGNCATKTNAKRSQHVTHRTTGEVRDGWKKHFHIYWLTKAIYGIESYTRLFILYYSNMWLDLRRFYNNIFIYIIYITHI